jgi:hypothetical protein
LAGLFAGENEKIKFAKKIKVRDEISLAKMRLELNFEPAWERFDKKRISLARFVEHDWQVASIQVA